MSQVDAEAGRVKAKRVSVFEIFRTFLALGFTSFGGPIAHLGYFRRSPISAISERNS